MMQHLRRLATRMFNCEAPPFDEERQECDSPSSCQRWSMKYLRFPRLTKVAVFMLLMIDLAIVGLLLYSLEPLITLLRRNEELFSPTVSLSHNDTSSVPHYSDDLGRAKIPRILHQTCANSTIPEKWIQPQQSCRETYSDFEYKLWTDELARDFLSSEYPWFLDNWDNYAFPIQRADAIRYFVLHHYGGIYLDMDTFCTETIPLEQLEAGPAPHYALFKSTLPTGVTNDFMISTARHPAYAAAVSKLPFFYDITRFWAELQPYANIMMSSGPLFLSLVVKDYLLGQPSLPSPTVEVIHASELAPYITDLESATWHKADAHALMWLGTRPWTWFLAGAMVLIAGLYLINYVLLLTCEAFLRKIPSISYAIKESKLA
ncbi:glycosyltransferase family 32 protein [Trichoderma ceciliae]